MDKIAGNYRTLIMLTLADNLKLPVDYVTWKAAIIGRTGSGKTNTAVVLAEQMIEAGYPLVIIEPQGDWWGIRSKYKIAILGGEHGDIPLEPTAGELAADFVISERVPVLLDLFHMGEGEMVRFATDFARRLWAKNGDALHVFLDEADLFAPQKDLTGPKAACLGAWQNIVRRGRSRGIGCTMITQRTAVINKDLLTQADPLIVHRLTAPQDLAAVAAHLDVHGLDRAGSRAILSDVARLTSGEAYVISPGTLQIEPTRVSVRKRKSFDSSATPEAGKAAKQPRDLTSIDLQAMSKQFAATIERAKADDPKELRRQIAELKKQVAAKPKTEPDQASIDRIVAARDREWQQAIAEQFKGRLTKIEQLAHVNGEAMPATPASPKLEMAKAVAATVVKTAANYARKYTPDDTAAGVTKAQQRLLDAIAWWESIGVSSPTRNQVGIRAKVNPGGGYFDNTVGPLVTAGYVVRESGSLKLTDSGRAVAHASDDITSADDYHAMLRGMFKGATLRLLEAIIQAGGRGLSRDELGQAAGVNPAGGYFDNSVGPLSSLGLIERRSGSVYPTTLVFPRELS